jgi:hypothetical protein
LLRAADRREGIASRMMTGETQIDYEALAQEAMRGIVRSALRRIADLGYLPGEHHFYIAFDTRAPGVVISKRLKQKYPEEMTIVLQHQFRELNVDDDRFEVTLSFNNVPERLTVPLRAVRVFFDPSVRYGIQFDSSDLVREAAEETEPQEADAVEPAAPSLGEPVEPAKLPKPRGARKSRGARNEGDETTPGPATSVGPPEAAEAAEPDGAAQRRQPGRPKLVRSPSPEQPINAANDAKVVQLDKFRKR